MVPIYKEWLKKYMDNESKKKNYNAWQKPKDRKGEGGNKRVKWLALAPTKEKKYFPLFSLMDLSQRKSDAMNLWAIVCCLTAVCFLSGFGITDRFCLWHLLLRWTVGFCLRRRILFFDGRSAYVSGVLAISQPYGRLAVSPPCSSSWSSRWFYWGPPGAVWSVFFVVICSIDSLSQPSIDSSLPWIRWFHLQAYLYL